MKQKGASSSSRAARSVILGDHKRVQKLFIPKILADGRTESCSWVEHRLPELLWLGILNDAYGLERAMSVVLGLARAANHEWTGDKRGWWPSISSYTLLSQEQKKRVSDSLSRSNMLVDVQRPLLPLLAQYPECPLSFLSEAGDITKGSRRWLKYFRTSLVEMFDRGGGPATLVTALASYVDIELGHMSLPAGMELPPLATLLQYPETEDSQHLGGFCRSIVGDTFGTFYPEKLTEWGRYFWNRGLELEECEFAQGHSY